MSKFVVLSDAVVVTTGKKPNGRPQYARVLHGHTLDGKDDNATIAGLLRAGSIRKVKNREEVERFAGPKRHAQTVKDAAKRMGAPDDPVAAPTPGSEPLTPDPVSASPEQALADIAAAGLAAEDEE